MAKKRKGGLGQRLDLTNTEPPKTDTPKTDKPDDDYEIYEDRVFDKATNSWVTSPYEQYKPDVIKDQPNYETPKREPKLPQVQRPPLPTIHDFSEDHYNHYQVADMLGYHPDTIYKLTAINRIPVRHVTSVGGNHRLWYKKDDIHFMKDKLEREVFGKPLQNSIKEYKKTGNKENPIKTINNVSTLLCPDCNVDVPIEEAVMHEKAHKRGAM